MSADNMTLLPNVMLLGTGRPPLSINIACPPGPQQQTCHMLLLQLTHGTGGHSTITQTLPHTMRAMSKVLKSDVVALYNIQTETEQVHSNSEAHITGAQPCQLKFLSALPASSVNHDLNPSNLHDRPITYPQSHSYVINSRKDV